MKNILKITLVFCLVFSTFAFSLSGALAQTVDLEAVTIVNNPPQPVVGEYAVISFMVVYQGEEALAHPEDIKFSVSFQDFTIEEAASYTVFPGDNQPLEPGNVLYYSAAGTFTSPGQKVLTATVDSDNQLGESNESNNTFTKNVTVIDGPTQTDKNTVSYIKFIQTALELYYNDEDTYPVAFKGGNRLGVDVKCISNNGLSDDCSGADTVYMDFVAAHPSSPTYDYRYHYCGPQDYIIEFYLDQNTNSLQAGLNYATGGGISNDLNDNLFYQDFDVQACLNDEILPPNPFDDIKPGWLVKSKRFAEVFYVDNNLQLRWIVNEQAANRHFGAFWQRYIVEFDDLGQSDLSYGEEIREDNFSVDAEQTDGYRYSDIRVGWLVKSKRFAEVFFVDGQRQLRWVPSEFIAEYNFGPDWAAWVIEFEDLSQSDLEFGPDYTGAYETDQADYDRDGLNNRQEADLGTDPYKVDTDGDGLTDRDEVKAFSTDPLNPDTDGDGFSDGDEVRNNQDPKVPA